MPTNRFSTISARPIPWSPATVFKWVSSAAGLIAWPSTATGSPFSYSISMISGSSGAFSGATLRVNMSSSGATSGSSSAFPS